MYQVRIQDLVKGGEAGPIFEFRLPKVADVAERKYARAKWG